MRKRLLSRLLIPAMAVELMVGAALCQAPQEMPPRDELGFLKNALQTAGAQALTSEQEAGIKALIAEFGESHRRPTQDTAVRDARSALENAILNGDLVAARAQAETIGDGQAKEMVQREVDTAAFALSVIDILKTGTGQVSALVSQMDTHRLVQLVLNLAGGPRGGPGGFGRMGGRPGPGGPGPRGPAVPD